MAHFAELDESNNVINILVIADSDCLDGEGNESEAVGVAFCETLLGGGIWKQTSYNHNFKKQYAGIVDTGMTYDPVKDVFVKPKPHPSWTLDSNSDWQPPYPNPFPQDGSVIDHWDEDAYQADNSTGWVGVDTIVPE